jgi:alpha-mannosidase II
MIQVNSSINNQSKSKTTVNILFLAGWLKTFERYFADQTKHILDSMLEKLRENPELKFIWAEISYFNLWWENLGTAEKQEIKK